MIRSDGWARWWSLLAVCAFVLSFFVIPQEDGQRQLFNNLLVGPWVISLLLVSYRPVVSSRLMQFMLAVLLYLGATALWFDGADSRYLTRTFREVGHVACLLVLVSYALYRNPNLMRLLLPPLYLAAIVAALLLVLRFGVHHGWSFEQPLLPEWKFHNQNRLAKTYGVMLFLGVGGLFFLRDFWSKSLAWLNVLIALVVILLTRSKGAAYAVLLTLPFLLLLDDNIKTLLRRYWLRLTILLLLVGGLVLALGVVGDFSGDGWSKRNFIWPAVVHEWLQKPLFGHGYMRDALIVGTNGETFYHEHNLPLALLRQSGVVGLVLFVGALLWLTVQNFRSPDASHRLWGVVLLYCLFASLSGGKFPLLRPEDSWFWTWVPIAFALAACIQRQNSQRHET